MRALRGQRILVTRTAEDSAVWAAELGKLGAYAVVFPCIECETIDTPEVRDALAAAVPASDWLVFTSRRGIEAFAKLHPRPVPSTIKVAVVGPATAALARETFGRADVVAPEGTAASLGEALADAARGSGLLSLVVAENAGATLEKRLGEAGLESRRIDVYRTVPAAVGGHEPRALSALGVDNVFLASPSAVAGFIERVTLDRHADVFSIGPATSAAARRHGLEITGEARRPTLEGLVEALQCAT